MSKLKLSPEETQECIDLMEDCTGISFTPDQFTAIIARNPDVIHEVNRWGAGDTVVREEMMGVIGQELTGLQWPINGDSAEYKEKFYQALEAGIARGGYQRVDD
jgi:hypothetical protein